MEQQNLSERFFTVVSDMRRHLMQAKPFCGISHSEMPILHLIDKMEKRGERVSTTWLSAHLGLTKSSISQVLNSLEEKGWIRRAIDPENRRKTTIDLTDAGREKMRQFHREGMARIEKVLDRMGHENAEKFIEMVELFLSGVKAEMAEASAPKQQDQTPKE
jgi:DNA-binding MarR family transcriptional regulator